MVDRLNAVQGKRAGDREYILPNGDRVPSVTTFLKVLPAPALVNWKLKRTAEWAVDNREAWQLLPRDAAVDVVKKGSGYDSSARDAGDLVHRISEDVLLKRTPSVPSGYESVERSVREIVEQLDLEVLAVEPQLYSSEHAYAGSADLVARLTRPDTGERVTAVLDWKSGAGLYGSTAYQLMAYGKADRWVQYDSGEDVSTREAFGEITQTFGIWLRPSGFAIYPMAYDDNIWTIVRAARAIYDRTANDWGYRFKPINPNPVRSKGPEWPSSKGVDA